jgi:hypothetical protein
MDMLTAMAEGFEKGVYNKVSRPHASCSRISEPSSSRISVCRHDMGGPALLNPRSRTSAMQGPHATHCRSDAGLEPMRRCASHDRYGVGRELLRDEQRISVADNKVYANVFANASKVGGGLQEGWGWFV